jgi:excinuclease UvrABC ATPase subunit
MKNSRYASKNRNTVEFAQDCGRGEIPTAEVFAITVTSTECTENQMNTDDLVVCTFSDRIPEYPCPMCHGWGFVTNGVDQEFKRDVRLLSETDIAGWLNVAQSVAARRACRGRV